MLCCIVIVTTATQLLQDTGCRNGEQETHDKCKIACLHIHTHTLQPCSRDTVPSVSETGPGEQGPVGS